MDLATLVAAIEQAEDRLAGPWHLRPLPELIDFIVQTYHRPLARELADAEAAAARLATEQAGHCTTLAVELADLRDDLTQHMSMEERMLFPWLRGRASTAAAPIRAMQLEHADTILQLLAMQATTRRCVAAAAANVDVRSLAAQLERLTTWLCEHIHLESNELFPRALQSDG